MTIYFAHHALYGTHGLQVRDKLLERSRVLERELTELRSVRDRLKIDVNLLDGKPPNRDIVEELARDMLGMLYRGERVLR